MSTPRFLHDDIVKLQPGSSVLKGSLFAGVMMEYLLRQWYGK
jgi:hypothetical protein